MRFWLAMIKRFSIKALEKVEALVCDKYKPSQVFRAPNNCGKIDSLVSNKSIALNIARSPIEFGRVETIV